MSKIIKNPENGAEIKNFIFKNEHFMDAESGQSFMPGTAMRVDDDLADFMLGTWEFLKELTIDEAKEFLDAKEELKCEKCEYKTKFKVALFNHNRKHLKESEIEGLVLPTLEVKNRDKFVAISKDDDRQKKWDDEDKKAGLIGEGLTDDRI